MSIIFFFQGEEGTANAIVSSASKKGKVPEGRKKGGAVRYLERPSIRDVVRKVLNGTKRHLYLLSSREGKEDRRNPRKKLSLSPEGRSPKKG